MAHMTVAKRGVASLDSIKFDGRTRKLVSDALVNVSEEDGRTHGLEAVDRHATVLNIQSLAEAYDFWAATKYVWNGPYFENERDSTVRAFERFAEGVRDAVRHLEACHRSLGTANASLDSMEEGWGGVPIPDTYGDSDDSDDSDDHTDDEPTGLVTDGGSTAPTGWERREATCERCLAGSIRLVPSAYGVGELALLECFACDMDTEHRVGETAPDPSEQLRTDGGQDVTVPETPACVDPTADGKTRRCDARGCQNAATDSVATPDGAFDFCRDHYPVPSERDTLDTGDGPVTDGGTDTREPVARDDETVEEAAERLAQYPTLMLRTYHNSGGAKAAYHTHPECQHVTRGDSHYVEKDPLVVARMWDLTHCDQCQFKHAVDRHEDGGA